MYAKQYSRKTWGLAGPGGPCRLLNGMKRGIIELEIPFDKKMVGATSLAVLELCECPCWGPGSFLATRFIFPKFPERLAWHWHSAPGGVINRHDRLFLEFAH